MAALILTITGLFLMAIPPLAARLSFTLKDGTWLSTVATFLTLLAYIVSFIISITVAQTFSGFGHTLVGFWITACSLGGLAMSFGILRQMRA